MNLGETDCEDGNWNSAEWKDPTDIYGTGSCNCTSPGTARNFFRSKRTMAQAQSVAFWCTNTR